MLQGETSKAGRSKKIALKKLPDIFSSGNFFI